MSSEPIIYSVGVSNVLRFMYEKKFYLYLFYIVNAHCVYASTMCI